ncbi:MAG: tetratricopeptide repeat protein [Flavobacteriales bacterium]|nr:tetratricopeptide repeat protein [Flavobacteriales bacterium]
MSLTILHKITSSIDDENRSTWKIVRNNPSRALSEAHATLSKAKESDYTAGIAWALGNIGAAELWQSNYEEALEHTTSARELLHQAGDLEHEVDMLYNLCVIFYFLGEYEKQIHYAKEALNLANEISYDSGKASALNGIGLAYYTTDENEEAIKYLKEGKEIAEKIDDKATLLKILDSIGQSYYNLKQYDEALTYKTGCAKVSNEVGEKSIEAYALDGIGEIYLRKQDFENALAYFNQSLALRKELGFKAGEAETNMHMGELYFAIGKNDLAIENLKASIALATDLKAHEIISKSELLLANHYEKVEDFKHYITHFKAYHAARDQFNKEAESKKLRTFELKGRLEQMREEKALLEQKNEQLNNYFQDVQTLSEIGNEITTSLSISEINQKVYENVNKLMKADGFGIGIWHEEDNTLSFPGYIENGEKLEANAYDLNDMNRLACVCFNNQQEIVINNFTEEYQQYIPKMLAPVVGKSVQSIIYLPLTIKGRKIGVVTVQCFEEDAYSDYHVNFIKNLAIYISIALDNARMYESMEEEVKNRTIELEKNYENSELLSKMGQELISTLNFEDVTERLYKNVNQLMDANIFGVRLYNEAKREIEYKYDYEDGYRHEGIVVSMNDEDNYSVWCIKNNQEIFINDNKNEYIRYVNKVVVVAGEFPQSLIFYPLRKGNKVIGLITVQSLEKNAYTKYHLTILKTLAHYTVIALENARHYEIMEEEVAKRTQEILHQKEIIEEKNKHIMDSIHYAKRIQDATLPDLNLMKHYLKESFVLFKPKDIVSGDFYWIEKKGDEILFAVVDCTGHGVPGAFLSLIGYNSLNKIVNELNILTPSDILEELNKSVFRTLQNNLEYNHIQDGMDMSICSLNTKTNVLQFAGAYNPLYIVSNNTIREIKGDKISIGSGANSLDAKFSNNVIQLSKDDCIYLFSDGYADQFGGPKGKKFKYSRFKELLVDMNRLSMDEQGNSLDRTIAKWQGDLEQIDDVCVIGIKAS